MIMRRPVLPALILILCAACESPTAPERPDPCEPVHACLVEGVDLDLRSISVASIGTHPVNGLPLVPGDSIQATVVVLNRGTLESEPGTVAFELQPFRDNHLGNASAELPSIAPGRSYTLTVAVPVFASSLTAIRDERLTVQATVYALQDSIGSNDRRTSAIHVLATPLLQLVAEVGEGLVGGEVPVTLTLINHSTTRSQPTASWIACFYDSFRSCAEGGRSPSGPVLLPEVAAGSRVTLQTTIPIPPEAAYQDEAFDYSGFICLDDYASDLYPESGTCFSLGAVTIRPDYQGVCAPPLLTETAVQLTAWNCGNPHLPRTDLRPPPFHLVALDAQAGVTYRIERSTGGSALRFYDVDGEPVPDLAPAGDELRVGADERIYIVSYSAAPDASFRALPLAEAES